MCSGAKRKKYQISVAPSFLTKRSESWLRKVMELPKKKCGNFLRTSGLKSSRSQPSTSRGISFIITGAQNARFILHASIFRIRIIYWVRQRSLSVPKTSKHIYRPSNAKALCKQFVTNLSNSSVTKPTVSLLEAVTLASNRTTWWSTTQAPSCLEKEETDKSS